MIHIENNQNVPENDTLRVLAQSGDYSDNDLIECYDVSNPGVALVAFPASFIRYGGIVNRFTNPALLGEELVKIDPQSTHDAAVLFREEDARRKKREMGDYTPENPVPADENISPIAQEAALSENTTEQPSPSNTSPSSLTTNDTTSNTISDNSAEQHLGSGNAGLVAGSMVDVPGINNITSTSTPGMASPTSTDPVVTTTSNTSSSSSTVSSIIDTATTTAEKIADTVETIIDTVTGSSTPN